MLKTALRLMPVFLLALLAGPLAFVLAHMGTADANDLYLVLDFSAGDSTSVNVIAAGARAIGPQSGLLSSMFEVPPHIADTLSAAGYIMLPAGPLAALCGLDAGGMSTPIGNT